MGNEQTAKLYGHAIGFMLSVLVFSFGIAFLTEADAENDKLYEAPYLGIWAIITIITYGHAIFDSIFSIAVVRVENEVIDRLIKFSKAIFGILFISCLIWGWIIFAKLENEDIHKNLWTWFNVIIWSQTAFIGLMVLILIIGGCVLCYNKIIIEWCA